MRGISEHDVMADHARRSTPLDSPYLSEFAAMDMDERWVSRSPEAMLETFHWFRGEGFGLVVLERDRMFTERLHGEAERLGLPVIEVDITMTEDDLAGRVTAALRL